MTVRVRLLGGLSVEVDGVPVPDAAWRRRHAAGLVALLALEETRRLHREQVLDALWPGLSIAEAAPRFHKAAHHARRSIGTADAIVVAGELVSLLPDSSVVVDVHEFGAAAAAAIAASDATRAAEALELHGGELLPAERYEEWAEPHRERLRLLHLQLLRLAGRWEAVVELDPTDEHAHIELMRSLHDQGAHRAALLHFERFDEILRRDVGVEPGPAAIELRDRIRAAAESETVAAADSPPANAPRRIGDFPFVNDEFFGRASDLASLRVAIATSRIVTLFGPGGVGKTRLAVEFARTHPHDCVFVDLSRAAVDDDVAAGVLGSLGVSSRSGVRDVDRVIESLEVRPLALILDNCEQVIDAVAELATRVAAETAAVRVVATSREALDVDGEVVVSILPLALPPDDASTEEQRDAEAIRFFCERVERAGGEAGAIDAVVRLVRMLDGIPLALELAAARSRTFSVEQILEQLQAGGSVRAARRSRGPAHHASLDDAVDWSYRLLDDDERSLLLRLSAFQGSFDLNAVIAIADVVPIRAADLLARLVDKSLVQSSEGRAGRRLRLLDTVRRFAAARLDEHDAEAVRDRHARHFADQVERLGALVPGPEEDHALAQLGVELDDIAAAFTHAVRRGDPATAARLADGPRLSLSAEGARWTRIALRAVDVPNIALQPQYVSILASAAWGAVLRGELRRARQLAEAGIECVGDPARQSRLCWIWPQAVGESFAAGVLCCLDGASTAHDRGDAAAESFLLATAAIYSLVIGDESAAIKNAERALELAHEVRSRSLRARAAGALAYSLQDIDAAAARRAAAEVLEVAPPGDFHLNMPHRVLANLAWREGDAAAAARHAVCASELIRDQGDRYVQAAAMRQLAVIVGDVDRELAAELLGVADGIVPGIPVIARDAAAVAALEQRLLDELGADELAARRERGRRTDGREAYTVAARGIATMRDAQPTSRR